MENFSYIKGKDANPQDKYAYVKKPLLSEIEKKNINNTLEIMYIDLIHIGKFINFGFNSGDSNNNNFDKQFYQLISSMHNQFTAIKNRIELIGQKLASNQGKTWENGQLVDK